MIHRAMSRVRSHVRPDSMVSFPVNLRANPTRCPLTRPPFVLPALPLFVFLLWAFLLPASPGGATAQEVSLAPGTPAPDAELRDLDGNPVRLLDYVEEGKPALLEFWASWCENCEALQPQLEGIRQRWGDELTMVAIAVAVSQSQRRVKRHVEEHDPGYPYLWDHRGNAVRAYNAATTSIVVILDREGRVAYTGVGGDQELVPVLEGLLEG